MHIACVCWTSKAWHQLFVPMILLSKINQVKLLFHWLWKAILFWNVKRNAFWKFLVLLPIPFRSYTKRFILTFHYLFCKFCCRVYCSFECSKSFLTMLGILRWRFSAESHGLLVYFYKSSNGYTSISRFRVVRRRYLFCLKPCSIEILRVRWTSLSKVLRPVVDRRNLYFDIYKWKRCISVVKR